MDFSEKWGTNVENAVELALIDLKLTRDEVDVIVLEEPSKGFFGIGSKLAKVRVEKKKETLEDAKKLERENSNDYMTEEVIMFNEVKKTNIIKSEGKRNKRDIKLKKEGSFDKIANEKPENLIPVNEDNKVLVFLKEISEKMGIDVNIKAMENEEIICVDIDGKDSGTIIGKRGQTLDAIQYLASLVANKGDGKYVKVVVDAENYRKKRERTLEQLANRLAQKVSKTGKSVKLEPMNPYERKVIHATLQSNPNVTTRSEGEEPYRRVIIDIK